MTDRRVLNAYECLKNLGSEMQSQKLRVDE